jgi:transcriptional regulator with XRE-family HTH domain
MTATILQFRGMATPREQLPNRIRELREAKDWTQTDLAERMRSTYATIGRFETGTRPLNVDWMRRFAKALDCSIGDLLLEKDNPKGLSADEQRLLDLIRGAGPDAAQRMVGVAELTLSYRPEPQDQRRSG